MLRVGLTAGDGVGGTGVKVALAARGCGVTVGTRKGVHVGGKVAAPSTVGGGMVGALSVLSPLLLPPLKGVEVATAPGVQLGGRVGNCSCVSVGATVAEGRAAGVGGGGVQALRINAPSPNTVSTPLMFRFIVLPTSIPLASAPEYHKSRRTAFEDETTVIALREG